MAIQAWEIERAYRNDMSLRRRLGAEEWQTYLRYACHLAVLSERWSNDPLTSSHILDARIQILQIMLKEGHDIRGVNMFTLLEAYKAQLEWTWQRLDDQSEAELEDSVVAFEVSFMHETLRPEHFQKFLELTLRCEDVLRTDPKIFVPGITRFGHT